jgi:hypothetical protein
MQRLSSYFAGAIALVFALNAQANSFGAPVCDVPSIPFAPMSNSISNPAPQGWLTTVPRAYYRIGEPFEVRITNPDPLKQVRGVLLWAKFSNFAQAGRFALDPSPNALWQYIPPSPSAQCAEASITHTSAAPKAQSSLVFSWTPPSSGGAVFMRAYLIENCMIVSGCRSAQALTPIVNLIEAEFISGFE